jgi:hypothetical protein
MTIHLVSGRQIFVHGGGKGKLITDFKSSLLEIAKAAADFPKADITLRKPLRCPPLPEKNPVSVLE